jgi:hypothetical protein
MRWLLGLPGLDGVTPGAIVTTGSLTPAMEARAGETWSVRPEGLSTVSTTMTAHDDGPACDANGRDSSEGAVRLKATVPTTIMAKPTTASVTLRALWVKCSP